jgi:hypothetical protein
VLFHEVMSGFDPLGSAAVNFKLFEAAAGKKHQESIWMLDVVKDVDLKNVDALKETFTKTEEPLGWYFAGVLSESASQEKLDFFQRSAEGGCSWGQAGYALMFKWGEGGLVERSEGGFCLVDGKSRQAKQSISLE